MKKLNLGCGGNILSGWENHDMNVDITKPLPWNDGTVDVVLAEHVVEHTTGPQALRFVQEAYRILKPGGCLRLCCPVVGPWLGREVAVDLMVNHGHLIFLNEESMRTLLWAGGFAVDRIKRTDRRPSEGHWKIIGEAKDEAETCRLEAVK